MKPFFSIILICLSFSAIADVQERVIHYQDGATKLKAFFYWDDKVEGKQPGVIVVHEWWGLNDYARKRAKMLAEMGYTALAIDMYGDQHVTQHAPEAQTWMKQITENQSAWLNRAHLGLKQLIAQPETNAESTAAIGYCFGGATVLQMAYADLGLKAVASFHGSLPLPSSEAPQTINTPILIAHGEADSFVPESRVTAFKNYMNQTETDYIFASYSQARHAFTNANAQIYGIENVAYHAKADQRSWAHMKQFLQEKLDQ